MRHKIKSTEQDNVGSEKRSRWSDEKKQQGK